MAVAAIQHASTHRGFGNCGLGAAPHAAACSFLRAFHGSVQLPVWDGYSGYFEAVDFDPPSINIVVLAGHGTIRGSAMANETASAERYRNGNDAPVFARSVRRRRRRPVNRAYLRARTLRGDGRHTGVQPGRALRRRD